MNAAHYPNCAITLITKDRTQIEIETLERLQFAPFYSSISQQFISEITVNISFHKRRTAGKDRTMCGFDLLHSSKKGHKFWYYSKKKNCLNLN